MGCIIKYKKQSIPEEQFLQYLNKQIAINNLFETNGDFASKIYEALGFNKQINEIADTKKVDEFIKKYKDALPNIKDGKTLISHLQTVSNRNTGTTKQFADLIIKLSKSNKGLEKLLNNPNLYAKPNSVGDEGAFHWSLFNNLSVNKIVLELDHFKTNTYDDVFLHELIHNLTTQFIVKDSDLFNQNFYNKVKELYSVFDNHLEANKKVNEPLLKSTKDDVKNLKRLKEYFEFLPSDAIQQELLFGKIGSLSTVKDVKLDYKSLENKSKQDVIKELERLLSFKESRIQEIEKGDKDYYYFNSKTFKQENVLSEFLATFINDANFREQLKNIDYKNNKSIFQAIIDLISEFIGLTKNDSLYNEFVLNLTNFINNNDYSTIAEQTQKTAYQNRINLLEQQKQQAQQLYSQYLQQNPNGSIEQFKSWISNRNTFDKELAQKIQDKLQRLYPEIKLNITNNPIWEKGDNVFNQEEYNNQVNYRLKATEKVLDNLAKIKQWESNKSIDKNTLWKKIGELGISKQQLELLKESEGNTIEEKLTNFVANYSYTVEINTAKENLKIPKVDYPNVNSIFINGKEYKKIGKNKYTLDGNTINYESLPVSVKEYLDNIEVEELVEPILTQHYSNLTVPGGTNYTENEIATPGITPSIKGHAQFATDKGLMWSRTDEKIQYQEQDIDNLLKIMENSKILQIKCS